MSGPDDPAEVLVQVEGKVGPPDASTGPRPWAR